MFSLPLRLVYYYFSCIWGVYFINSKKMDRRRDTYSGGYRSSRTYSSDSQSSRSSRDGGAPYRGRGGGGRGGGRGGYGAPGGRSGADDSTTSGLPAQQPQLFTIPELEQLPPVPPKGTATVRTNGYEIDVSKAKKAYQYDIKWTGESKKGKKFDMNKQTKDDVKFQLKQNALLSVFYKTINQYKDFFRITEGDEQYAYDSGSMFFCQRKLLNDEEVRTFDIDVEKFDQCVKDYYPSLIGATAEIRCTREILPDSLNGDLENDRPAIQYLELVFSQAQRRGGSYLSFGNRFYDRNSKEEIERMPLILKEGVTRSIRIIGEPSDKKLMVQMVPTKATFYDDQSLERLIEHSINGRITDLTHDYKRKLASNAIKHICLETTHLEKKILLVAAGLTTDAANRCFFEYNGKKTDVDEYFREKYNIRLRHPDLPCVIEKKGRDKSLYPIELLRVPENQRVPKAKQGNELNSLIIRKCQMLPSVAVEKIEKNREDADILNSNLIIKNTGARVYPSKLVTAPAKQLPTPSIIFKDTQKTLNNGVFGMQTGDKFIRPATVRKMACILASNRLEPRKAEDFVNQFLRRLQLYGVQVDKPDFYDWSNPDRDYERLEDYAKKGYDFAFI
uniref:PAZ domain-containing protein n=1 Tax=Panagrolaimus sp. PS1159 TaxID=55785 RepID=A0AC35G7H1_9BILA